MKRFRPCIDLHEGVVKQIVGSSLTESDNDKPAENFVSKQSAAHFARLYQEDGLFGGHVIMLGKHCEAAALEALSTFPGGLQVGGGITQDNAMQYLQAGAAQVIVTSFVFHDGSIDFHRLSALRDLVGRHRLVLDLSCRRKASGCQEDSETFFVVTNKWTKYTDFAITPENLTLLASFCCEFLVHGVDVEGKRAGIESDLVQLLGNWAVATAAKLQEMSTTGEPFGITYAGGVRGLADLDLVDTLGQGQVDVTVGSALDIFGGDLSYKEVVQWHHAHSRH